MFRVNKRYREPVIIKNGTNIIMLCGKFTVRGKDNQGKDRIRGEFQKSYTTNEETCMKRLTVNSMLQIIFQMRIEELLNYISNDTITLSLHGKRLCGRAEEGNLQVTL